MKIMSTVLSDRIQIHSGITYLSIDLAMFPQISGVFCKILPNFSKKNDLCDVKKVHGQMANDGQLPITAHQWSFLNIEYNVWFFA